jgi:EpsI family protein
MNSWRLVVAACCIAAAGGYLGLGATADAAVAAPRLSDLSSRLGEWRALEDIRLDRQTEQILQADSYLLRTYTRGSAPVTLFVAFYATQRSGHTIHSPLNCLPGTGWQWTERRRESVTVDPVRQVEINRNVASLNRQQVLVYYWYQSRGRVVASDYWNRLLLVQDALKLHRSDGALVRVTVPVEASSADDATSFIRTMFSPLAQQLPE